MLVLTRKQGEIITIGDDVTVEILEIRGSKVRIGVVAPPEVAVHRQEVWLVLRERPQLKGAQTNANGEETDSGAGATGGGEG